VQIGDTAYLTDQKSTAIELAKSTNKTTWTAVDSSEQSLVSPATRVFGLLEYKGKLVTLGYSGAFEIIPQARSTAANQAWSNTIDASAVGNIFESSDVPRGFIKWHDAAGATDLFVSTNKGLFHIDVSAGIIYKLRAYRHQRGSYTGQLLVGPDELLYITDGPNIVRMTWGSNGQPEFFTLGPASFDDPGFSGTLWDGLPLDLDDEVTAIASCTCKPWIFVAMGGLKSTTKARIGIYNFLTGRWNWPYKHATAERAITALYNTVEDDGTDRLHFLEEQAAGGDQDPHFLEKLVINPANDATWKYALTGKLTTSHIDGGFANNRKGFYAWQTAFEGLDTSSNNNEKITIKAEHDGGTVGDATGQVIYSDSPSPSEVWTDKTDASIGEGTAALRHQAQIQLDRGSTSTKSPKLLQADLKFKVKGLRSNNKQFRAWRIPISLKKEDYESIGDHGLVSGMQTVIDNLHTSADKATLVAYDRNIGDTAPLVDIVSIVLRQTVPEDEPIQRDGFPGIVEVVIEEVI
jgi:hypothetical protein